MKRLVMIALALSVAVPVLGQVEFTFEGYAVYTPAPDMVGCTVDVYGIANPPVSVPTPIPTNFFDNQYTIHVEGMTSTSFVMGADTKDWVFDGGSIAIFEDAIAGGTAGDYAVPATFTDGLMLLSATVDDGWAMHLDDPFGFGTYSGAGIGSCDMAGGSAYQTLVNMNYTLDDWVFTGTGISEPWLPFITVPQGYHHVFGVKLIFPYDPTSNEDLSWGAVKSLFD